MSHRSARKHRQGRRRMALETGQEPAAHVAGISCERKHQAKERLQSTEETYPVSPAREANARLMTDDT